MFKVFLLVLILFESVNLSDVTYYEILGVSKQASTQEIRQAYKKLAVKLHPDKNTDEKDQKKFLEITEAYETLKDSQKRQQYDLYGSQKSYTRKYDYHSQTEYNNLYYNGLYHDDPFVESLSGGSFYTYLNEGLHFINFYSPFCPPCQSLADHWKKLAEVYKGIVKVAAVNCKHYNSFCFNNMRIGSYPSLLFYPHGKKGGYLYYNGAHRFDDLEEFVLKHIRSRVNVARVSQVRQDDSPTVYVVDKDGIDNNSLMRIAFQLNGLATVVIANDNLRQKLTESADTTVVFKYKKKHKEIHSTDEKTILQEIVEILPRVEKIGLENLKKIRNDLRNGEEIPWVLYFSKEDDNKLLLYQLRMALPDMNFGEINCQDYEELCNSLQVENTPAWATLKVGGAYQRAFASPSKDWLRKAARAHALHTLSASDLKKILDGDMSTWVLLVSPYQVSWEHMAEPFTEVSMELRDTGISFGIMSCTSLTDQYCQLVAHRQPVILVQNGTRRHTYSGQADKDEILQFVTLLRESADIEISEQQALEILDASSREHAWLVAYLPAHCGRLCAHLMHEWRLIARRLRPLEFVRVGVLQCARAEGLCSNVRAASARLYPIAAGHHYTISLEHMSQAPYILEWALGHLDDSVLKMNWQIFSKNVIAEELNPSRNKKPWLVYFHSPRCYHCYEMYPDFAILAIHLSKSMHFGKVNCITERSLCQHEHITSYPSIRLYLNRNQHNSVSRVVPLQPKHYENLLQDIRPHLKRYDDELLQNLHLGLNSHIRDEL